MLQQTLSIDYTSLRSKWLGHKPILLGIQTRRPKKLDNPNHPSLNFGSTVIHPQPDQTVLFYSVV